MFTVQVIKLQKKNQKKNPSSLNCLVRILVMYFCRIKQYVFYTWTSRNFFFYRAYAKKKMLFLLQRFLHTSLWGDGKRNLIKTKTNKIQPAPASSLAITTEDQNKAMQENEKSKPKPKVNKQMSVSYLPSVY